MYLTVEKLRQCEACEPGIKWFERWFPQGGELKEIMQHKYVSAEFLHWGYENLVTSDEEKAIYREKLRIDNKNNYQLFQSENIQDGQWISKSNDVIRSQYIFEGVDISHSCNVLNSKNIETSCRVYESEFVYGSYQVHNSKNVTDSRNIIASNYIVNSHSIINSSSVSNSAFVSSLTPDKNKRIKNSQFIFDCQNINNCLFCQGLSDVENMIFNQAADPSDFVVITKQMASVLKDWEMELVVNNQWSENTIPITPPIIQRNIIKQYANLPDTFWRWIKTLPSYDPQVVYSITYNPKAFN